MTSAPKSLETTEKPNKNGPKLEDRGFFEPEVEQMKTYDSFEDGPYKPHCVASCECRAPLEVEDEVVRWRLDARKLESQDKQVLSPECLFWVGLGWPSFRFELLGGRFRLMLLARETRGKGCRSFVKAKGCGRVYLKCAQLPAGGVA